MELRRYFSVLRRRWLLILVTLIGALGASYLATPRDLVYTTQSTVVVGPRQFSVEPGSLDLSADRATGLDRLLFTYAVLLDSDPIAADAAALTGVARTSSQITAATEAVALPGTQLLQIAVSDPEPAVAQALANGLAEAFVARVETFTDDRDPVEGSVPGVPVYVFEQARLPTQPAATGLLGNLVVAGLFGLLAAIGLVVLLEYLDVTVKDIEDGERRLGLPVLGAIPSLSRSQLALTPGGTRTPLRDVSRRSA